MNPKTAVANYSSFLAVSWQYVHVALDGLDSSTLRADWLQANWEIMVEEAVGDRGVFLEPYGDGADCNGSSSRVSFPSQVPTHRLFCKSKNGERIYDVLNDRELAAENGVLAFDRLVTIADPGGWYEEVPPFDMALCDFHGEAAVVYLSKLDLYIDRISD